MGGGSDFRSFPNPALAPRRDTRVPAYVASKLRGIVIKFLDLRFLPRGCPLNCSTHECWIGVVLGFGALPLG